MMMTAGSVLTGEHQTAQTGERNRRLPFPPYCCSEPPGGQGEYFLQISCGPTSSTMK